MPGFDRRPFWWPPSEPWPPLPPAKAQERRPWSAPRRSRCDALRLQRPWWNLSGRARRHPTGGVFLKATQMLGQEIAFHGYCPLSAFNDDLWRGRYINA
jgi:hypothetical protein